MAKKQLIFVVLCLFALWAIWILHITRPRCCGSNSLNAYYHLRSIYTGQHLLQISLLIDKNKNGIGEFGTLADLTVPINADREKEQGGFISKSLRPILVANHLYLGTCRGYFICIFLPGIKRVGKNQNRNHTLARKEDASLREKKFRVYAWPMEKGDDTFAVDQNGEFLHVKNIYHGLENMPCYYSAVSKKDNSAFCGELKNGEKALDGNIWYEVGH